MRLILQYPQGRSVIDSERAVPEWQSFQTLSEEECAAASRIGLHSRHFSLIPADLFDPADQEASLHQLGMKPGTATAVQTIPEWDARLVYSLESLSPGMPLASPPESIWRGLLFATRQLSSQFQQPGMLAMIIPGQLYLLAYDGRQLQFFNTFPTPDIHDYLYFILNGLDQWGQSPFHTPVHLAGHVVADSPLYGLLETYLRQVRMVDQHLLPSNWVHPHVSGTQFFDLLSFAACGSSADN